MRENIKEVDIKLSPSSEKYIWTTAMTPLREYLSKCQSVLEIVEINPYTLLVKYVEGVLELPEIPILELPQDIAGKTIVKVLIGEFKDNYGAIIYRDANDSMEYFIVQLMSGQRARYDSSELIIYA